jgi:hypothetical protein
MFIVLLSFLFSKSFYSFGILHSLQICTNCLFFFPPPIYFNPFACVLLFIGSSEGSFNLELKKFLSQTKNPILCNNNKLSLKGV